MTTIKCVLVDDEVHAIGLLRSLLEENCPQVEIVGEAQTVEAGIREIKKKQPDLVFLDIKLHQLTGFDLLDQVDTSVFEVIFTTAYDHYTLDAFDRNALHYLMKPINVEKLEKAIKRAQKNIASGNISKLLALTQSMEDRPIDRIALPNQQGNEFIAYDQIVYCMASGSYTHFYLKDGGERLVSKPIGHFEEVLDPKRFCRVHKKYLVNSAEITFWERGKTGILWLTNGASIEVSVNFKDNLMNHLKGNIRFHNP